MYGVVMAFKDFRVLKGILHSPWVGFDNFEKLFNTPWFSRILKNTLIISALRILFGFPAPIILALLLNEIRHQRYKKIVQSVSYLPHFLSWVILGGIFRQLLSPSYGAVNAVLNAFGIKSIYFLAEAAYFRGILIITGLWKDVGWSSILYLAAISSIDAEQYESAHLDGANRFQQAIHITVPSIMHVITILFILNLGGILDAGFDQIFNLYNPRVYVVADIIDTYVYRVGIIGFQYSFSVAVGLFKNVIGFALIISANLITRKFSEYGLW